MDVSSNTTFVHGGISVETFPECKSSVQGSESTIEGRSSENRRSEQTHSEANQTCPASAGDTGLYGSQYSRRDLSIDLATVRLMIARRPSVILWPPNSAPPAFAASCLSSKSEDVADFDYKPTACKKKVSHDRHPEESFWGKRRECFVRRHQRLLLFMLKPSVAWSLKA